MNSSPVTAMAEVVGVQYGCTYTIKIPGNISDNYTYVGILYIFISFEYCYIYTVADYDGDNVRCRWASSGLGECNEVCQALPGSFLNEVYKLIKIIETLIKI